MIVLFNCGNKANENSERTMANENMVEIRSDLIKYNRKWIQIKDEGKDTEQNLEIYISERGDTIYNQNKFFINGKLDSTTSEFYELNFSPAVNGKYEGKITVHSSNIHKIKSPIKRRRLQLYLLNKEDTVNTDFQSTNMNHIEFSYLSSNDTLRGILIDKLEIDTIVDGDNKVRLLESRFYLDNKSETINTLIEAFEKNKN